MGTENFWKTPWELPWMDCCVMFEYWEPSLLTYPNLSNLSNLRFFPVLNFLLEDDTPPAFGEASLSEFLRVFFKG